MPSELVVDVVFKILLDEVELGKKDPGLFSVVEVEVFFSRLTDEEFLGLLSLDEFGFVKR